MIKKIIGFVLLFCICNGCSQSLHKNKFVISGTYLEVISPYSQAASIVHKEFKRLNKVFNIYDIDSEISRLNRTYNQPVKVSNELIELIKLSKEVNRISDGAFDISCGVLFNFWKSIIKNGSIDKFPTTEEIDKLKELCGMQYIDINEDNQTITITKEGLKIDLGAIAKGYMVDSAVEILTHNNIDSALINAGGDIYCLGKNGSRSWQVGLKDPSGLSGIIEQEAIVDEAVATSGNYEQFFEYEGVEFSHLIDPRTGFPVKHSASSVTVISKNCTTADSLATAFFVLGTDGVSEFLSKNRSTMRIYFVSGKGEDMHIQMYR
ncbi:MAG: FAD:protein FMN transferase [Candidatus Omnitrophica bacterium]|nr:FAD:protein FMN transferase [Candidatus Omnitrophota bacterium]